MTPEQTAQIAEIKERERLRLLAERRKRKMHSNCGCSYVPRTDIDILLTALEESKKEVEESRRETAQRMKDVCADVVPTSWLDSLLSGPDNVLGKPPWGCPDVERLLAAIKDRLAAITLDGEDGR